MLHCQSMKKVMIFVFLSIRLEIHMMKHGNIANIYKKVGHYFKLQNYLCIQVKICFYQPDQSVLIFFFLPSPQLAGLFPVHATRPDLNGPILSAHVWACSFNSQLKTNIIRPQKCSNCLFSISMSLSFFWGFTRHFYSCQYLVCQKKGIEEQKGGLENKWITGHLGGSKTIEKTVLLNTWVKQKLKYSGKMYIVLYKMQRYRKKV